MVSEEVTENLLLLTIIGGSMDQVRQADANDFLGPSRCFPFWQELLACYVVNTTTEDVSGAQKCVPALEDYYECLHHKKEVNLPTCFSSRNCRETLLPRQGADEITI